MGALNVLSNQEIEQIWIPYIIFENTDSNEAITIEGAESTVYISKESKKFHCTYLLHDFPFDSQVCFVHMVLKSFDQDIISLIPDNILMESPLKLSQYRIENWKLDYFREDDITAGLKMEV